MSDLDPVMEAALLKQTEEALREFTQAAVNCGMSKVQMALMLRARADELASAPALLSSSGETLQ